MLKITTLMDNVPSSRRGLVAEHGLSYFVETDVESFLFDCGQGPHTVENAQVLGLARQTDAVILSHAHYDHCGGYRYFIRKGYGSRNLFTGPHFFEKKYAAHGMKYTDLSAGFGPDFLEENGISHHVVEGCREISSGMFLVTGFPRETAYEKIPQEFMRLTPDGMVQDEFPDEICLVIERKEGMVVLAGCSHPGIVNMARHVKDLFQKPVYAIFGGTHLMAASEEAAEKTIDELQEMGVTVFGMGHCTGEKAEEKIRERKGIKSCHLSPGDCFIMA